MLDEDYYFKLMDFMQQQKLSDAMLLYDDINSKGFEGDQVLNGFAEFIRNLLVCKDEKAAVLLDVVENFREKYLSFSKSLDSAYLIGLLNILNEAEINYKAARNKRLHVELALIKLSYLQQAIELLANGGLLSKKKGAENPKPVAFRKIRPIELIEKQKEQSAEKGKGQEINNGARLTIQTPTSNETLQVDKPFVKPEASAPSMEALSKIRMQFANRQRDEEQLFKPLEDIALKEAWQLYTQKLKENKHSATQSFERAGLKVIDPGQFEVIANNNLEQKFIEQEKRNLSDWLKQFLNNKSISFSVIIRENQSPESPNEKHLSKREQYQQIIEQYPLVKELKDRLRLELDY